MTVQQTSIEAFASILPFLPPREAQVLDVIGSRGPLNNRQIAECLGLPINSITPRVHELREAGLVIDAGYLVDPQTHRRTHSWKLLRSWKWTVPSDTVRGKNYLVERTPEGWTCACSDHVFRDHECKHIRKVRGNA